MNERFTRTIRETHDKRSERTTHERTSHWSVTIYYPMTSDPGSIEFQSSLIYTGIFLTIFRLYNHNKFSVPDIIHAALGA